MELPQEPERTIERKSASDLAGTLTSGRKRFLAEIERLREYDFACVVVEAELSELCKGIPFAPSFRPRTIFRSVMFWQLRYPSIRWWAVPGREVAQAVTYQLLRTWWRERIEAPARKSRRKEEILRLAGDKLAVEVKPSLGGGRRRGHGGRGAAGGTATS